MKGVLTERPPETRLWSPQCRSSRRHQNGTENRRLGGMDWCRIVMVTAGLHPPGGQPVSNRKGSNP